VLCGAVGLRQRHGAWGGAARTYEEGECLLELGDLLLGEGIGLWERSALQGGTKGRLAPHVFQGGVWSEQRAAGSAGLTHHVSCGGCLQECRKVVREEVGVRVQAAAGADEAEERSVVCRR
jgi:hypothetical protein